ncbi:MAG: hypothetical protein WA294_21510 [Acidobacteriaceae bacterium]
MPRIIHFGRDGCWRTPILRNAGYEVVDCVSLAALLGLLDYAAPDAVVVVDSPACDLREVRERSTVPLILFQSTLDNIPAQGFDWVVAPQTHPQVWLRDLCAAIERSKVMALAAATPTEGARPDAQVALEMGAEASRVTDWHSVAISIARRQTPSARAGEAESAVGNANPARQV